MCGVMTQRNIDGHGWAQDNQIFLKKGHLKNLSTPLEYRVVDTADPKFLGVYAGIDENFNGDRILIISIRTKLPDGRHSTVLSGKEQYRRILEYFEGKFDFIQASWFVDSDNLSQFNYATMSREEGGLGLEKEDAVWHTWSGKRALEAGFAKIVSNSFITEGIPGKYEFVEFLFAPGEFKNN